MNLNLVQYLGKNVLEVTNTLNNCVDSNILLGVQKFAKGHYYTEFYKGTELVLKLEFITDEGYLDKIIRVDSFNRCTVCVDESEFVKPDKVDFELDLNTIKEIGTTPTAIESNLQSVIPKTSVELLFKNADGNSFYLIEMFTNEGNDLAQLEIEVSEYGIIKKVVEVVYYGSIRVYF